MPEEAGVVMGEAERGAAACGFDAGAGVCSADVSCCDYRAQRQHLHGTVACGSHFVHLLLLLVALLL